MMSENLTHLCTNCTVKLLDSSNISECHRHRLQIFYKKLMIHTKTKANLLPTSSQRAYKTTILHASADFEKSKLAWIGQKRMWWTVYHSWRNCSRSDRARQYRCVNYRCCMFSYYIFLGIISVYYFQQKTKLNSLGLERNVFLIYEDNISYLKYCLRRQLVYIGTPDWSSAAKSTKKGVAPLDPTAENYL